MSDAGPERGPEHHEVDLRAFGPFMPVTVWAWLQKGDPAVRYTVTGRRNNSKDMALNPHKLGLMDKRYEPAYMVLSAHDTWLFTRESHA